MERITGPGRTDCYRISHESDAEVLIASHGGHLISWKTADGIERLYLSPDAEFSAGKAIRGGVPVIFPQFSDHGPFGRHGFARKSGWIADCEAEVMRLGSSEKSRADWPFDFKLELGVRLFENSLEIQLTVQNSGSIPFAFQAALHTYFQIYDVTQTTVSGLESFAFKNEVTGETGPAEDRPISFGDETDLSYTGAGDRSVKLVNSDEILEIESENFPDVVVWNPGPAHGIGDLPDDGWKSFVCIESARVQDGDPLPAGESWHGIQRVSAK